MAEANVSRVEDYRTVVARLRTDLGVTIEDIAFTARQRDPNAPTLSSLQKALAPGSTRQPSVAVLEALAAGLRCNPQQFVEYRLAKHRALFDESIVGLEEAARNLQIA